MADVKMRAPFGWSDLEELDACFLAKAAYVVALEDVLDGERAPNVVGLRHDCDNRMSLATAVEMARWEQERGYRSTYFVLHTAPYWRNPWFASMLEEIAACGHEIGLHNNALAEGLRTGQDPYLILEAALDRLRGLGHEVRGTAGHGDHFCNYAAAPGEPWFANDEIFEECRRERIEGEEIEPNRLLWRGRVRYRLQPRPLADFGLDYEGLWLGLPFPFRFSDSGGEWRPTSWDETVARFAAEVTATVAPVEAEDPRQLHLLIHPDWWGEAFRPLRAAA